MIWLKKSLHSDSNRAIFIHVALPAAWKFGTEKSLFEDRKRRLLHFQCTTLVKKMPDIAPFLERKRVRAIFSFYLNVWGELPWSVDVRFKKGVGASSVVVRLKKAYNYALILLVNRLLSATATAHTKFLCRIVVRGLTQICTTFRTRLWDSVDKLLQISSYAQNCLRPGTILCKYTYAPLANAMCYCNIC